MGDYLESLSRALDIEAAMPKERPVVPAASAPTTPQQQNFREKRKWDEDRTPHEIKRQQSAQIPPQIGGRQTTPYQGREYRPKALPCAKCSKIYFGECKAGLMDATTVAGMGICPENARTRMLEWRLGRTTKGHVRNYGHCRPSQKETVHPHRSSNSNVAKGFPLRTEHML